MVIVRHIARQLSYLRQDQRGLFAVSHLATTLFFTVTLLCILNVGTVLIDKTREQRIADAAAETLGTWKARNLNAVVAHQHLTGELLSLVMIHHAIGGENLDNDLVANTRSLDQGLQVAYVKAQACTRCPPHAYDEVASPVYAGESLLKAHRRLKRLLTYVYRLKAAAAAMMVVPPTRPAGEALADAADVVERLILREWQVLEEIRENALALKDLKQDCLTNRLPAARQQLKNLIEGYGDTQRQLVDQLEELYGVHIQVLETDTKLPVKVDPMAELLQSPSNISSGGSCDCPTERATNLKEQLAKVTQLSRATFPWVNYHRKNLVGDMKERLPLSKMGDYYFDHTNGVAKRMAFDVQTQGRRSLALYVLNDYEGPDKGFEPWTEIDGSGIADKSFGLTVLVGMEQRMIVGPQIFASKPTGFAYRYASAFVWNREKPVTPGCKIDLGCKRIVPSVQAETGFDTLNWKIEDGSRMSELVGIGIPHRFPKIAAVWTSQITPTTPARLQQLQVQPLQDWAADIKDVLPDHLPRSLVGM